MKVLYLVIIVLCLTIIGFTKLDAFSESGTAIPYSVHPINDTAFAVTGVINNITENALVTLEIKNHVDNSVIFVAQTIPAAGSNFTFTVPKTGPLWNNVKDYSVIVNYMNSSASQNNLLTSADSPHGVFSDIIKVPNSLQTQQRYFHVFTDSNGVAVPGSSVTLYGTICPQPVPDFGTNYTVKTYYTFPSWDNKTGVTYFLGQSSISPSCAHTPKIITFTPNFTGQYNINAVAQWTEKGKTVTVQDNSAKLWVTTDCPGSWGTLSSDNRIYHPGDSVSFQAHISFDQCHSADPSTTLLFTVYNYTENVKSNILYQELEHIASNTTQFNFVIPKWTDDNGLFHFVATLEGHLVNDYDIFSIEQDKIPKSYDITMWANPSSFPNDGSGTTLFLKTCPFTPMTDENRQEKTDSVTGLITDPGSSVLVEHHITSPNGTVSVQQDTVESLQDCNKYTYEKNFVGDTRGVWSVYDTIKWSWNNSIHESSTKPIDFTITPTLYRPYKTEEIDSKEIFSKLDYYKITTRDISLLDLSKDGKSVLFLSNLKILGTMSPTGENVILYNIPSIRFDHIIQARFSPNADSVIFLGGSIDHGSDLYKLDLRDKKLSQLTNSSATGDVTSFATTPDGNIVYGQERNSSCHGCNGYDIWLAGNDGNKISKLFEGLVSDDQGMLLVQDISHDGNKVLLSSDRHYYDQRDGIVILDVKNKKLDSSFENNDENYRFAPSDDLIVYDTPDSSQIEVINTDNSYHEILSGSSWYSHTSFVTSQDGQSITYAVTPGSSSDTKIFRIYLTHPVSEFPFAIAVFLASVTSMIVFYRIKFA